MRFHILIAVSFALNATLLGLFVSGLWNSSSRKTQGAFRRNANERSAVSAPANIDPAIWPAMQTDDLAAQITRLQAAGFPKNIIYPIISARVDEAFRGRFQAIPQEKTDTPFWKLRSRTSKLDLARSELHREKQKLLTDLLGEDPGDTGVPEPMQRILEQRLVHSVPTEKLGDVQKLLSEFADKRSNLARGSDATAYHKYIAALERTQRAALAQILSPGELVEYELRMSESAEYLRFDLADFDANEAEFRRIFPLWQSLNERFGEKISIRSDTPQDRVEARRQLVDQVKAALGSPRGEDYERATDRNYRNAKKLVERLQLPPETANQLWSLQKETQQRAKLIAGDAALSRDEQNRQIAVLAEQARAQVTAALGEQGFQAYPRYGGEWMQALEPPKTEPAIK
ncbi:MAG: hypothetical protein ABIY47_21255 [Opitutaceae bacterium]